LQLTTYHLVMSKITKISTRKYVKMAKVGCTFLWDTLYSKQTQINQLL